jgi:hypothetical protein
LTLVEEHCHNDAFLTGRAKVRTFPPRKRSKIMGEPPQPTVTAMLVCERIIAEAGSSRKSLIGIYDSVGMLTFPAVIPQLAIYVRLADAVGVYQFKLRIVNLKDEALLSEVPVQGDVKDPLRPADLVFNLLGLPIPEPGKYEFQLYANGLYCNRATLDVKLVPPPQGLIQQQGGAPSWQPPS